MITELLTFWEDRESRRDRAYKAMLKSGWKVQHKINTGPDGGALRRFISPEGDVYYSVEEIPEHAWLSTDEDDRQTIF